MAELIKEYDEDLINDIAEKYIKSNRFQELLNKEIKEHRKTDYGIDLKTDEFDLVNVYEETIDDVVYINVSYKVNPERNTFKEIVGETIDTEYSIDKFTNYFEKIVEDISNVIETNVWNTIYEHNILRKVYGSYDSIMLGDTVEFNVKINSKINIILENVL